VPPLLKEPGWNNYALEKNQGYRGKGPATEMADLHDEGYTDGRLAALAVETLKDLAARKQPFFLAVGFFTPHLPFCAPRKYWDLDDPDEFELARNTEPTLSAPDVAYHEHRELGGYKDDKDVPKDEKLDADRARHFRHGYYACVSYADARSESCWMLLGDSAWKRTRSSSSGTIMGTPWARPIAGARVRTSNSTPERR